MAMSANGMPFILRLGSGVGVDMVGVSLGAAVGVTGVGLGTGVEVGKVGTGESVGGRSVATKVWRAVASTVATKVGNTELDPAELIGVSHPATTINAQIRSVARFRIPDKSIAGRCL